MRHIEKESTNVCKKKSIHSKCNCFTFSFKHIFPDCFAFFSELAELLAEDRSISGSAVMHVPPFLKCSIIIHTYTKRAPWTGWLLLHEYGRATLRSPHQIKLWWTDLSVEATSGPPNSLRWSSNFPPWNCSVSYASIFFFFFFFVMLLISLMSSSALSSVFNQSSGSSIYEWSSFSAWIILIIIWLELQPGSQMYFNTWELCQIEEQREGYLGEYLFRKSK